MCNLQPILDACRPKGIPVIEDTAQAFGAVDQGRYAGTIADVGVFSFGLLKNVTSFLGGAVVTRDEKLANAIRRDLAQFPLAGKKPLVKKMMTAAAFDIATMPVVFDAFVYWLFRYAYLHDLDFFNNKLDTDSNPKAYSTLPAHYSARLPSMQADLVASQLDRIEGEALKRRGQCRALRRRPFGHPTARAAAIAQGWFAHLLLLHGAGRGPRSPREAHDRKAA